MTFWFDREENELIGNNLGEFTTVTENGEVHIDVGGIMERGRGTAKLKEMVSQIVSAIIHNA